MRELVQASDYLNGVLFLGLGLAALRHWAQRRDAAAAWVAATFMLLGTVAAVGLLLPEEVDGGPVAWFQKALIIALVLFPYLLYRFSAMFERPSPVTDRSGALATAALVLVSIVVPPLPGPEGARPLWFQAFVVAVLVQWTLLSVVVAVRLWRGGRGQPTVTKRRMRVLCVASVLMNLALVLAGTLEGADDSAANLIVNLLATASAVLFFGGFAPPPFVRLAWRRPEEDALRRAQLELMAATTPAGVTTAMLPHVAAVVGGRAVALVDPTGDVVGSYGALPAILEGDPDGGAGPVRITLECGTLLIWTSPHTPFFGREELGLLRSFGVVADLALARCALLERERESAAALERTNRQLQEEIAERKASADALVAAYGREREAREAFERTNGELESFVYSVSHDLKSPMISLLGYLDYLKLDFGDALPADALHYLDRMSVSGAYMQALIQDLLELSRVGRSSTEREPVDLANLVDDVADEVRSAHPDARVELGPLPVLTMNPLRARQLLTNLIGNAVDHGGHPGVRVLVAAEQSPDRAVVVSVHDDGPGIPEAYREKVFGVFERLVAPEGADSGTGIGLAICRKIMQSIGGSIWVADSETGTKICASFPADLVDQAPTSQKVGAR